LETLTGPRFENGIAYVEIDRPEALNALNQAVRAELEEAVDTVRRARVRVLVLSGAGEKAFAAGADVSELADMSPEGSLALSRRIADFHRSLADLPAVVIASVRGWCLGGGFELALACDIIVAAEDARFGLPEIGLGIVPGGGGITRLTRGAGAAAARLMTLSGKTIKARRAYELGLVGMLAPSESLDRETRDIAARIATYSPHAIAAMKRALAAAEALDFAASIEAEAEACADCFGTDEQRRLMREFVAAKHR
jgi:enoyl-CoA hydratase/carnithine racemase